MIIKIGSVGASYEILYVKKLEGAFYWTMSICEINNNDETHCFWEEIQESLYIELLKQREQ